MAIEFRNRRGRLRDVVTKPLRRWLCVLVFVQACLLALPASGATVVVNNVNAAGEGFNDPTPVSPVTGNPGTTLGAQRLNAFEAAADAWAATLVSPVTIVIDAQMTSLDCDQNSAVLGSAGPNGYIAFDFPGAPVADTWYPQAMVNALGGSDIDPARADVSANFNQDIGTPGCLESVDWSYVIGAPEPPGTIPFTATVFHEIGHGIGFLTFVNKSTGAYCCSGSQRPDHYSRFLLDETPTPTLWTAMTNAGRANSATDDGNLTWSGPRVAEVAGMLTNGRHASGRVQMYAPTTLASGSSVSHWDTDVTPTDIMEPFLQSNSQTRLTNHLMLDVGWNAMVALAVTNTDGLSEITAGSPTSYAFTIANNGPADITAAAATVTDAMPAALTDVTWTCAGSGGASCGDGNGAGDIDTTVTVPLGGTITFDVDATVDPAFTGTLSNTVTVAMPARLQNTLSGSATDETTVVASGLPPGVTVSAISGATTEAGGAATFTLVLDTRPTSGVTIPLSSSDMTEGAVSPPQLVFSPDDWSTPQQATVTGVDDDVIDGDVAYAAVTGAAVSLDSGYGGMDPGDVSVTNLDDDVAGAFVSTVSGDATEAGGTAAFTLALDSQPAADVTIGLSSGDLTEGTVTPPQLVFTSANWSTPQQVTVTGVDDDVDDGDVTFDVITAAAASADTDYDGLDLADVAVTTLDDDTAGITVSAATGDTAEWGETATFTVVLDSEPTANVTIGLASSDTTEGSVAPAPLVFTPANWFVAQQATVTGVDDPDEDGDIAYTILTEPAASADGKYGAMDAADVPLTNRDDDFDDTLFESSFE